MLQAKYYEQENSNKNQQRNHIQNRKKNCRRKYVEKHT